MDTFTDKEFFKRHAADFNFELDRGALIDHAIKRNFIKCIQDDLYIYADDGPVTVIGSENLNCKLVVCKDDKVYVGMLGDIGYRQYYELDQLSSDLVWVEGEQLELDLALQNYERNTDESV